MPVRAALTYLYAKIRREIYITDMLFYAARGTVAKPEQLPRYFDLVKPRESGRQPDYSARDVAEMFRGRGKLC